MKLLYSTGLACLLSRIQLFATPCAVAYQAPLSMGFYRQEYWSGWPFPSPGDLRDPGIELGSPALQADSLLLMSPNPWTSDSEGKNLPAMQEICDQSLGWKDPLEKGMATHSNILDWKIPWTEEPGGLQSMGS